MMVSKVAVIALVAIVACPILLGYAMNLQEVTVTDYTESGESVNVTPLLQDDVGYTYVHADLYSLNANFLAYRTSYGTSSKILPVYESVTSQKTSFPMKQFKEEYNPGNPYPLARLVLSEFSYMYYEYTHPANTGQIDFQVVYAADDYPHSILYERIHSVYYDGEESRFYITYYNTIYHGWLTNVTFDVDPALKDQLSYKFSGSVTAGSGTLERYRSVEPAGYVDLSSGFTISDYNISSSNLVLVDLPQNPRNALITLDLNSISDSSYSFNFGIRIGETNTWEDIFLEKTTDGDGVHWNLYSTEYHTFRTELYYDSSRSSNTYQVYMNIDHFELRYVGNWPTIIGAANYYQKYEYNWQHNNITNLGDVFIKSPSTPKMRIDDSEYRAFEYPVIRNKTYTPSDFKTNPSTTIGNPTIYGSSIVFGGNTYTVSDGKITLGSKQIPVKDLILSSVPTTGGYENRIGNTPVSVTADPSTIRFNGEWSASISTIGMESTTYTKTEWTPGQFGWDGIDQNFLMVGLLTSLGVFIALGIYIRRTKANLWPLLVVCGGAAVLFFCML